MEAQESETQIVKKKKNPSKYNYTFGDEYPGTIIGHRGCNPFLPSAPGAAPGAAPKAHGAPGGAAGATRVPCNMGWLWNATDVPGMKYRKGWQPGGVAKSVAKLMTFKCPRGGAGGKDKNKKKKKKKGGGGMNLAAGDSEPEEPLDPKPTLKVQRKGDTFTISVAPLKDLAEIAPNEDPYVDCDPMVFKIIKNRSPEEKAKVEARRMVKLKKARDAEIRKALAEAAEEICKCAYMDVYCNDMTAIDKVIEACPAFREPECICKSESLSSLSSNATWDIEYTPPFGVFDLAPRKTRKCVHVETQYIPADAGIFEPPQKVCPPVVKATKPNKKVKKSCQCP